MSDQTNGCAGAHKQNEHWAQWAVWSKQMSERCSIFFMSISWSFKPECLAWIFARHFLKVQARELAMVLDFFWTHEVRIAIISLVISWNLKRTRAVFSQTAKQFIQKLRKERLVRVNSQYVNCLQHCAIAINHDISLYRNHKEIFKWQWSRIFWCSDKFRHSGRFRHIKITIFQNTIIWQWIIISICQNLMFAFGGEWS